MTPPAPPLQMIMDARGYIVLAHHLQLPIGTIVDRFESAVAQFSDVTETPVVVISHTTWDDWNEQRKLVLGEPHRRRREDYFYHRVVAE